MRKMHAAASEVLLVQDPAQIARVTSSFLIGVGLWAAASAAWFIDLLDTTVFGLTMVSGVGVIICRQLANRPRN